VRSPRGVHDARRAENWLNRRVKPVARELRIASPINFQVLRRTFATNAQGYGNPKDVEAHLRHSNAATTLNEYTQAIPESVRKLVNAVTNDVLMSKPKPSPLLAKRVQ
jgi:integrase